MGYTKSGYVIVMNHASCFRDIADLRDLEKLESFMRQKRRQLRLPEVLPSLVEVPTWKLRDMASPGEDALDKEDDDDDGLLRIIQHGLHKVKPLMLNT